MKRFACLLLGLSLLTFAGCPEKSATAPKPTATPKATSVEPKIDVPNSEEPKADAPKPE